MTFESTQDKLIKKVGLKGVPVKQLTQDELTLAVGMCREGFLSVFYHKETSSTGYQFSKLGRKKYGRDEGLQQAGIFKYS